MSKIASLNDNQINLSNSNDENSLNHQKYRNIYYYGSEQKLNPSTIFDDENKHFSNTLLKLSCNSCSIQGDNELFNSFINSKNNKNKELSLLYLINTFNKSYSNESTEKNNIIIDLPKISKKLFSNSHARHKSSTTLDCQTFQKNLRFPLPKHSGHGGEIVNNFFSSIYEKQYSGGVMSNYTISPKKVRKSKISIVNSGNKLGDYGISPFTNSNLRFSCKNISSRHENCAFNLDCKEQKKPSEHGAVSKFFNSSLLMGLVDEKFTKND
jgi:hypothetical protein